MPTGPDDGALVLDTTAYSHMRVGDPRVLDALAAADLVILPVIVLGELEAGFEKGRRAAENRSSLRDFTGEPWVEVQDVNQAIAKVYGRIFARLRQAGTPIPLNDVWIAATTVHRGARLLTFDGHFRIVEALSATILKP